MFQYYLNCGCDIFQNPTLARRVKTRAFGGWVITDDIRTAKCIDGQIHLTVGVQNYICICISKAHESPALLISKTTMSGRNWLWQGISL
jgi:hypothetical protein